ncbi:copper transport outer membrane protein MctB [Brevibacterium sanguinis]|uniref:Copper transport outer membrane protein MctB n=2 Tax=Brevibacterium TaxID=1696 RepID=A0A366ICQ0_9MICO|nr:MULTISPECIES: copper transporter [Brevibacterium]RBP61880.1 copper transport outer membrane protein MctB [Brevibacterium sanguinis]RBP68674.1 copper transport outer membrane protein MctB [Brevibacterium celere]
MIDFRYHLVSLVSVFLALAVGIVLGAGPLKEPIGASLQSQVDALRTDRDDLRTQLDAAAGNIEKQNEFITAAAPELTGGILDDTTISVVAGPQADPQQVEAVVDRITESGGQVSVDVSFVDNTLTLEDSAEFLKTLRTLVPSLPEDDATAIRTALVIALTGKATTLPEGQERDDAAKQAGALFDAFVDAGRLRTDSDHATTELFLVVDNENSQLAEQDEPTAAASEGEPKRTVITDFVNALTAESKSVVVAGDAGSAANGLVSVLRTERSRATTVDGLALGAGPIIAVRALAAGNSGTHGHYGFASDAEEILPGKE